MSKRRDAAGRVISYWNGERTSAERAERLKRGVSKRAAKARAEEARAVRRKRRSRASTLQYLRTMAEDLGLSVRRDGVGYKVKVKRYSGDFEGAAERFDTFNRRIARRKGDELLTAPNAQIDVMPPAGARAKPYTIDRRGGFALREARYEPGPGSRMMMGLREIFKHVGEKGYAVDVATPELAVFFSRRLPPTKARRVQRAKQRAQERATFKTRKSRR